MQKKLLVEWGKGFARPWLRPIHRALLARHGLVDIISMSGALYEADLRASLALYDLGDHSLSSWVLRTFLAPWWDNGLGSSIFPVPRQVGQKVQSFYQENHGVAVPSQLAYYGEEPLFHLQDLKHLDLQRGLSPRIWVLRSGVRLSPRTRAACATQKVCVGLSEVSADPKTSPDIGWLERVYLPHNRWWAAETAAAATSLANLSSEGLVDAHANQEWVRPGGPTAQGYWRVFWREREARLLPPLPPDTETSIDEMGTGIAFRVPLPEFGAIPFYHVDQVDALRAALLASHVSFSLLGTLCDADFRSRGIIAGLRKRQGYRRVETRGKPSRDPAMVEQIGRLVEQENWPKYQVHKRLGLKRPTVYGYLEDFRRMHRPT